MKLGLIFYLIAKGFELTGRTGVEIHELVAVHQQCSFLALVFILKGSEAPPLHLQDTGQVPNVALKGKEASPDLTVENRHR